MLDKILNTIFRKNEEKEVKKIARHKIIALGLILVISLSSVVIGAAYLNGRVVLTTAKAQWVSHTEYWSGDDVSTIVRLTDYKGDPLEVDSCEVTIMYPNKLIWINSAPMYESSVAGNWYRTDKATYTQGTYEQQVTCVYDGGKIITTAQSFHVNPALTRIQNISEDVIAQAAQLTTVHGNIIANVQGTNESINANVDFTRTTVDNLITAVNEDLSTQMTALGVDVDTKLTDVNTNIVGELGDTQVAIQSQLGDVEVSLSNLMNELDDDLRVYLTMYLRDINNTATIVYEDTQWLLNNAMNQDNAEEINQRFDSIDTNLAVIEEFCGNPETVNSDLCQEVYMLRGVVDNMRVEQTDYYNELDTTTTSTWDLLSGTVSSNIDVLLGRTEIIQAQTTEINETVNEIRQDQVDHVNMQVIS